MIHNMQSVNCTVILDWCDAAADTQKHDSCVQFSFVCYGFFFKSQTLGKCVRSQSLNMDFFPPTLSNTCCEQKKKTLSHIRIQINGPPQSHTLCLGSLCIGLSLWISTWASFVSNSERNIFVFTFLRGTVIGLRERSVSAARPKSIPIFVPGHRKRKLLFPVFSQSKNTVNNVISSVLCVTHARPDTPAATMTGCCLNRLL